MRRVLVHNPPLALDPLQQNCPGSLKVSWVFGRPERDGLLELTGEQGSVWRENVDLVARPGKCLNPSVRPRIPELVEISFRVGDPSAVLTGGQVGRVLSDEPRTLLSSEIVDGLIDGALNRRFRSLALRLTKGSAKRQRSEEPDEEG